MMAEFLGTAFLVAAIIGSGIMAERLAGGNVALALLANTIATGAALVALILAFGPISGAHLNPVVSLADAPRRCKSAGATACFLHRRSNCWRSCGHDSSTRNVRIAAAFAVPTSRPKRAGGAISE